MPSLVHHKYERLPTGPENQPESNNSLGARASSCRTIAVLLATLGIFTLGLTFGLVLTLRAPPSMKENPLQPLGDLKMVFSYNRTFGQPPSSETNEAWASIFPVGRGFVKHPEYAPETSGLAVFHELHCLNALRIALYEAQGVHTISTTSGEGHHLHHVRHCFDYLRQSLMCHADTSLEPVDWDAGGVTGWGSRRQCRDYAAVVSWANEYRTHDQTDIS